MGLFPLNAPVDVVIAVWPWGAYLGEEGQRRRDPLQGRLLAADVAGQLHPAGEGLGQYLNSILAKVETAKAGYEEAIMLDEHGNVSEGSGENVFLVARRRDLHAARRRASILDGITRRSVIQIAADLGFEVVERDIARGELYQADELS